MEEKVVLVNNKDVVVGLMEKQQAHVTGLLHRAISVFIFNDKGELLLQQRAANKYHSPMLWTNTCCSHPRENETYLQAANRRLREEMGIETNLNYKFHFIYKAFLENNLIEHELDYVFTGIYNENPIINKEEANDYKWISMENLKKDIIENKDKYTAWFKIIFDQYIENLNTK